MTTQQPTPYDAELEVARADLEGQTEIRLIQAKRLGYLRAKAEDADLLAACEALSCPGVSKADMEAHQQLRAATAKATAHQHRLVATTSLQWLWCPDCGKSVQTVG